MTRVKPLLIFLILFQWPLCVMGNTYDERAGEQAKTIVSIGFSPYSYRQDKDDPSLISVEAIFSVKYQQSNSKLVQSDTDRHEVGRYLGTEIIEQLILELDLPEVSILGDLKTEYHDGAAFIEANGEYYFSWLVTVVARALGDFKLFPFDSHEILFDFLVAEPCGHCEVRVLPDVNRLFSDAQNANATGSDFLLLSDKSWFSDGQLDQNDSAVVHREIKLKRIIVSYLLAGFMPPLVMVILVILMRFSPNLNVGDVIKFNLTLVIALAANVISMDYLVPDGQYLTLFNIYSIGIFIIGMVLALVSMFIHRKKSNAGIEGQIQ